MNCQDFKVILHEVARDEEMTDLIWDAAIAHAAECGECARLLDDARSFHSGVRACAAMMRSHQAPPGVERVLVRDFRRTKKANSFLGSPWGWALAATAALMMVLVMVQFWRDYISIPKRPGSRGAAEVTRATSQSGDGGQVQKVEKSVGASVQETPLRQPPHQEPTVAPLLAEAQNPQSGNTEFATDFIPLPFYGGQVDSSGEQLVRVELPRSALDYMGLPVNEDLSGGTVMADVLVGDDGLAEAIRFVRPASAATNSLR